MTFLSPDVSIVIAVRNASDLLRKTLACFEASDSFQYEIVIQDCLSTDDTAKVVQEHHSLPISFASESDTGIYDAWNKALARICGKWVIFIGAGDLLDWSSLQQCAANLKNVPESVDFFATPVQLVTETDAKLEVLHPSAAPLHDLAQGMSLPHPGLFHKGSLFSQHHFNARCRIAGDYDFLCRTLRANNIATGTCAFVCMLTGGVSGNMDSMYASEKELLGLSRKYFPTAIPWKPLMRLMRSGSYLVVRNLFGSKAAGYWADIPRLLQGKPRLWSLPADTPKTPLEPLSGSPSIDLLVATLGRVKELDRLLSSLESQTYTNFRILLADQNPSGFLDEMLAKHTNLPLTRISMPSRGVSVARNNLLELAHADIIVFPDDDCWYAADTLAEVVASFKAYPQCGALLGAWTPNPDAPRPTGKTAPLSTVSLFQQGGTCVQFFRKEAVLGLRFDPLLGPGTGLPYGCGEDTDYLLYAHKNTLVLRNFRIAIFHPSPVDSIPSAEKIARYAAGRMFLLKKHKFSKLFVAVNVLFPLCVLPLDFFRHGKQVAWYRWRMFIERLRNC